jgi:hypothetical protein
VGDTLEFYRYSDIPMITGPDGNMVSMWLIGVKLVNRAFKERYGAVINSGDTMEEYERRTTALWDAMVSGGTTLPIKQLLSIGTGGYFCSRAQRVECVTDAWVIAQDFAAPREFCQSYSVGDIIEAGTMLAPADMERLSSWPDWMAGVDIDSTLQGVGAPLRAKNAEVPVVTLDEVSTFELSGEGATAFFAQVNDSGWLSEVLAKNGHSVSVNPAKFLLGCLSGSGKVIRLQAWAANIKLHLWLLQQLAKVWPAHVGLLVVLEGDNENYARSLRSTIARLSELYNG